MATLNRLVAATDLSAPARHAVERAALLARKLDARLDVIHVADLTPLEKLRHMMGVGPEELRERVASRANEKLEALLAEQRRRVDELESLTRGARIISDVKVR